MCHRIKIGLKEVFSKLFGPKNELEEYLAGSQSLDELERRERDWHVIRSNFK